MNNRMLNQVQLTLHLLSAMQTFSGVQEPLMLQNKLSERYMMAQVVPIGHHFH